MRKRDFSVIRREILAGKLGGEPPEWLLVLPSPTFSAGLYDSEPYLVDEIARQLILEHFARRGNDLVIDYEHQTLYDVVAPAAGWIRDLESREDGVWARVDWTERAAEFIRAGEYRYFSPVFDFDPVTRRVTALWNVAITNWPKTHDQTDLTNQQIAAKARAKYGREEGMKSLKNTLAKLKALLGAPVAKLKAEVVKELLGELPDDIEAAARAEGIEADALVETLVGLGAPPAEGTVTAKVLLGELELPEGASLAQVQAKVLSLKSPAHMVAKADHDAVVAERDRLKTELEAAKAGSVAQQIDALVAANKTKLPPAKEKRIREIAKSQGLEQAKAVVALLEDVAPTGAAAQVAAAPEAPATPVAAKALYKGNEIEVDEERATLAAKVTAHQRQKGLGSYAEAYADLVKTTGI